MFRGNLQIRVAPSLREKQRQDIYWFNSCDFEKSPKVWPSKLFTNQGVIKQDYLEREEKRVWEVWVSVWILASQNQNSMDPKYLWRCVSLWEKTVGKVFE